MAEGACLHRPDSDAHYLISRLCLVLDYGTWQRGVFTVCGPMAHDKDILRRVLHVRCVFSLRRTAQMNFAVCPLFRTR